MRPLLLASLVSALATAGCFHGGSTAAPVAAPPAGPTGPAPAITMSDSGGFTVSHLPAVSSDGTRVLLVIADAEGDGGRGNPNLRLAVVDREDKVVASHLVLSPEEAEAMINASGPTPALRDRVAAGNAWLAARHAELRTLPMKPLEVERGEEIASSSHATGGEVDLVWKDSRIAIKHRGGAVIERATPSTWLVKDRPGPDIECSNPAFLGGARVDLERKLALVTVEYYGTDSCWEPPPTHHVVAW